MTMQKKSHPQTRFTGKTRPRKNSAPPYKDPRRYFIPLGIVAAERLFNPTVSTRVAETLRRLATARKELESLDKVPVTEENCENVSRVWSNYVRALLDCVRADKRCLWCLPDLRKLIRLFQHQEDRTFFEALALAVKAGVGRDERLDKDPGYDPLDAASLRAQGLSFGQIADKLGAAVEDKTLRRSLKRRGLV